MSEGRLFVISGPSAVGKGTIVKEIMDLLENVMLSISATTRSPREGEKDGVSYYFLSGEEFESRIRDGGFLEYANVHGNYYGTPRAPVEEQLAAGKDVILEIDVQGAMKVKDSCENGVYIFVLPPSLEELKKRIVKRGTESPEDMKRRLDKVMDEMELLREYDYFVINDNLDKAVEDVRSIIKAEHRRIDERSSELLGMYEEEDK